MKSAPVKSRVYARGQMVIPKVLRDRLGLRAGQGLFCWEDHGRLVVAKEGNASPLAAVRGVLRMRESVDGYLHAIRGPARPRRPKKPRTT